MFDKDAQVDQPSQSSHARGLASGFLAACAMGDVASTVLVRGIADAAPMAALSSIVFGNQHESSESNPSGRGGSSSSSAKSQWMLGKQYFFRGLLICAGRRHALGLENSGCQRATATSSSRATTTAAAQSSTFGDWLVLEVEDLSTNAGNEPGSSKASRRGRRGRTHSKPSIEDFGSALRPFLTYYAMMDQLSTTFSVNMEDVQIEEAANTLAGVIEACRGAKSSQELLQKCQISFDHDEMNDLLQKGMMAA
jgi:hypothetical protein